MENWKIFENFVCVTFSKEGGGMESIKAKVAETRAGFGWVTKVWNVTKISRITKIRLYKTLVIPVLLYDCNTWKMNREMTSLLT